MSTREKMPRCRGLLGFLFGHKFIVKGDWAYRVVDNCLRCGLSKEDQ